MRTFFLLLLAIIIVSLIFGPIGHYLSFQHGSPSLIALTIWGISWFGSKEVAYRWAVILGVIIDLLSFGTFGLWTGSLLIISLISTILKERFFEVISMFQSLLLLFIVTILIEIAQAIMTTQIYLELAIINIAYTLLVGIVVYYVVVIRYRLVQRWLGRSI